MTKYFQSTFGFSTSVAFEDPQVMSAVGLCEKLGDEKLLDAVTGLQWFRACLCVTWREGKCAAVGKNMTFVGKNEKTWNKQISWMVGFK